MTPVRGHFVSPVGPAAERGRSAAEAEACPMSMIGNFLAVSKEQLDALIEHPDSVPAFICSG
jgi:hypothetical protein